MRLLGNPVVMATVAKNFSRRGDTCVSLSLHDSIDSYQAIVLTRVLFFSCQGFCNFLSGSSCSSLWSSRSLSFPRSFRNSKKKSILNLASSKSTVHKPGTLPPSLFTLRKHKQKNSTGLQYGANASCNTSLYQVKGSSGQTAGELGAPAANGEHQKVLLPPPSLSSLPPLVVHMSEHSATAGGGKMDSLQPCFSVDTKDSKASGGGRAGENGYSPWSSKNVIDWNRLKKIHASRR